MIATARAHDMLVMAGCMIETSLGITAAAQFAPLLDCADFDGAALVADDPVRRRDDRRRQDRLPDGARARRHGALRRWAVAIFAAAGSPLPVILARSAGICF